MWININSHNTTNNTTTHKLFKIAITYPQKNHNGYEY